MAATRAVAARAIDGRHGCCRVARRDRRGVAGNAGTLAGTVARRHHASRSTCASGPACRVIRSARLESAATSRRTCPDAPCRTEWLAHCCRLQWRRALAGRATAGGLRLDGLTAHRGWQGARDTRAAFAGATPGTGDPRPRELLGARLCRRTQGVAGTLSAALLARRPVRGDSD